MNELLMALLGLGGGGGLGNYGNTGFGAPSGGDGGPFRGYGGGAPYGSGYLGPPALWGGMASMQDPRYLGPPVQAGISSLPAGGQPAGNNKGGGPVQTLPAIAPVPGVNPAFPGRGPGGVYPGGQPPTGPVQTLPARLPVPGVNPAFPGRGPGGVYPGGPGRNPWGWRPQPQPLERGGKWGWQ